MKLITSKTPAGIVVAAGIVVLTLSGCTESNKGDTPAQTTNQGAQKGGTSVHYTCSMHPEVQQDKPGDCPKCGMRLVEKK